MYKICPKCGAIAEYNAYYGRVTCTRCTWESEKQRIVTYRVAQGKSTARKQRLVKTVTVSN